MVMFFPRGGKTCRRVGVRAYRRVGVRAYRRVGVSPSLDQGLRGSMIHKDCFLPI